ncbi:hypothetical protein [Mesorhizobium sp. M0088]|uniref:hypothetical protein n=1 Tax=Mesorhizobium sp. M0088 TaxID=2956873 RepID=UPI0033359438
MSRSAPFPGVNVKKVHRTTEQIERDRARLEEIDARGRLYVSAEEIAAMQRGLAGLPREQRTVDLAFGPSGAWLRPNCPNFLTMFNFLLEYRQKTAMLHISCDCPSWAKGGAA